ATAPAVLLTLSLHDALPIYAVACWSVPLSWSVGEAAREAGGGHSARLEAISRPARSAKTSPSSRELEASRLAPCTPVWAHSPTAQSPGTLLLPARSVRIPPMA